MTEVYNRIFYGIYFHERMDFSGVLLYANKESIKKTKYEELRLEVELLREYEGQRNVLAIKFVDSPIDDISYETLFEPSMYYECERWQNTSFRITALAFIEMCKKEGISLENIADRRICCV